MKASLVLTAINVKAHGSNNGVRSGEGWSAGFGGLGEVHHANTFYVRIS